MKIQAMIDTFLVDRAVYCAPETIRYYRETLDRFARWCVGEECDELEQINAELLKRYAVYLRQDRKIRATSIHTEFRAINAFLRCAIDNGSLPEFVYKIRLPKSDPAIVLPLTAGEVDELLRVIASTSEDALRDMLLFRLMLDCGMRSSEVRNLRLDHVDIPKRLIRIVDSKCNKSRLLPLPEVVVTLLRLYLGSRYPGVGPVLLSREGRELTTDAVKNFFRKLKRRSGIQRVHAHLLRHTFATSYMITHNNIEYLRLYLGHEEYNVTRGYIHLASQCLLTHYDCYRIDSCFV